MRRIRIATATDSAAIAEVHVGAWRWAYRGQMPDDLLGSLSVVSRRAEAWRRSFELPTGDTTFVAEKGGVIVGFATVGPPQQEQDEAPGAAELHSIYIAEEVIGTGIGRALMDTVEDQMRANGAKTALLWVLETNGLARGFYENGGWVWAGTTGTHQVGDEKLAVVKYTKKL